MKTWSKSLHATRDGRSSSASRFRSFGPACLSSGRLSAIILCGLFNSVQPLRAQNWVSNNVPNYQWQLVASSADGSKLVAATGNYGPIYTSTNSGGDWRTNNAPDYAWNSVVSSADGIKMAAVGFSAPNTVVAYVSTNSGTTWTQASTLPGAQSYSMASSADGTRLVLAGWNSPIYVSTNSGATWTPAGTPDQYTTVASSADGTKLVAAGWNTSAIYVSTNAGATWTQHSVSFGSMWSSACSADGTKMVVVGRGDPIYLSSDSGTTWIEATNVPQAEWLSVASSADGKRIVAYEADNNLIYSSADAGMSWTSNAPPTDQVSLASSADGNKLVAVSSFGSIYTTYSTPLPQLNLVSSGGKLTFFWLMPSTNFVLQQNSDLSMTNWLTLTNTPILNLTTLQNQISLSPSDNSGFYRLAIP